MKLHSFGADSILIPSPNVTANHQEFNARVLEKKNAIVILEKDLNSSILYNEIKNVLQSKEENYVKDKNLDAMQKIYDELLDII